MADFIGMTRRLHADPELPHKVAAGRLDDIAPCTGCGFCLFGKGRCRINGLMGTAYNSIERAKERKKVVVIGGGPAGMEAARVSALRGHEVTLFERSRKLGGLLSLAAVVKGTHPEDLPSLVRYLERQIRGLGVRIIRGKEADPSAIGRIKPDAVFVATGGVHRGLDIPGADRPNVVSAATLHARAKSLMKFLSPATVRLLTRLYIPVGKRVIVVGGAMQGCETAEFLIKQGRRVTIVESAETLGEGMTPIMKGHLLLWLERKGVPTFQGVRRYVEITEKGLTFVAADGTAQTIGADTVLIALPLMPDVTLAEKLAGRIPEVHLVGHCNEPAHIAVAIASAIRISRVV